MALDSERCNATSASQAGTTAPGATQFQRYRHASVRMADRFAACARISHTDHGEPGWPAAMIAVASPMNSATAAPAAIWFVAARASPSLDDLNRRLDAAIHNNANVDVTPLATSAISGHGTPEAVRAQIATIAAAADTPARWRTPTS